MTAFHSANMTLDYQDIGSGPLTLVLLPGWCEPKTVFEPFIALAAERYRVISIDWRGHGLSSKAAGMSLAADDLLEDVRQLLTALRLDNVITLSVAHASWLAVALAEALPQRVRGMVFLDWIMTQPEPAFFTAVSRMQQPQQWLAARDALFDFWQGAYATIGSNTIWRSRWRRKTTGSGVPPAWPSNRPTGNSARRCNAWRA